MLYLGYNQETSMSKLPPPDIGAFHIIDYYLSNASAFLRHINAISRVAQKSSPINLDAKEEREGAYR